MSARDLARRRAAPLLLGALVGAMVAGRIEMALACVAIGAIAARVAGAGWPGRGWWRTLAVSGVLSVSLNAYLLPGAPLGGPAILGAVPSREGALQGLVLALRLAGAAVALLGLRAAWPGDRAADEIAARLRPLERLRVPVGRARSVVALAVRFMPLLGDEWRRVAAVQDLRAGRAARGPFERLERVRATLVPALVSSLERADQLALALEARYYRERPAVAATPAGWMWRGAGLALAGAGILVR